MPNLYENIISVAEAKKYLRLPPDFTEDDDDLIRMISASLETISKKTNYYFRVQDKKYRQDYDCNILVYDYPINTTEFEPNIPLYFSGYVKFRNTPEVTLSIGFSNKNQDMFPHDLIDCALEMIKFKYNGSESNSTTDTYPKIVEDTIRDYRRCIIV